MPYINSLTRRRKAFSVNELRTDEKLLWYQDVFPGERDKATRNCDDGQPPARCPGRSYRLQFLLHV
jgi:hypothetical protein